MWKNVIAQKCIAISLLQIIVPKILYGKNVHLHVETASQVVYFIFYQIYIHIILTSVIFDQYCIEFCFDSEGETTMPSVPSISNDTSSIQITYDQNCCKDKGVPEICMVLCTDSRFQERSLPPTPCDDHVEKIKKCLVPIKGNLFSSYKNISYAN